MRGLWLIPIAVVTLAVPAAVLAGSSDSAFDGVVNSIESRYHVHATRIPFLGLVSMVSRKATEGGVDRIRVAEFDNFHEKVDGDELNRMVEQRLGPGWERIIRETSRKGNEQSLIFVHPEGNRMGLFVLDLDGYEMDVVEISVDPDHLNQKIGQWEHHHSDGGGQGEPD